MSHRADDPDADERREVGGRIRAFAVDEWNAERQEERAYETGIGEEHHEMLAGELAGDDLEDRIQRRGRESQERRRAKHRIARPHDEKHADEPGDDEGPSRAGETLVEKNTRHQRYQDRRGVIERRGFGKRQIAQRGKEAQRRHDQENRARKMHWKPRRAQQPSPQPRPDDAKHDQRLNAPACPDDERYGIALREKLYRYVDGGETRAS